MRQAGTLAAAVLVAAALTLTPTPASAAPAGNLAAGYLTIELDPAGTVTGLRDSRTGTDYLAGGKSASLVSLVIDGRQERPTKVTRTRRDLLTFTGEHFTVEVRVQSKPGYTTLEATRIEATGDVQTLLWGPLATSITKTIGETVGVVRDDAFAVGLRPLTDRTEGAWPQEYQQLGWESEVEDNPSRLQVAPHEEWSAAGKTGWGSVLRAFTYDYTKERDRRNLAGYPIPVGPLPGDTGSIAGSKVALFGASPELTPTVLSKIAKQEGLPYPTQNGQWQKSAQASSQSFLVLSDLRTDTIPAAAGFAKAAGIGYVYSLPNAVGPWQTTGHYQFNSSLGGGDAAAAQAVELARTNGVRLGVHTISDFVSTNDRYVSPAPADARLATGQRAALTRPLAPGDTTLYLDSNAPFAPGLYNTLLRVGDEFIGYGSVQQSGNEWVVTGLRRAQWGSAAAAHAQGDRAARVIVNSYGGATGGVGIIDEIATRLATAWNGTGILANSYDGVESASESGWGSYGQARLVNGTYRQTDAKDGHITETSRMTSNTWDALTRASWGEVGVTTMNQVFINNEFYRANFLPGMLGWISLRGSESLLSVEGKLARGAGLNAGAGFQTSVSSLNAGGENGKRVLDAIKQWETARNLGAFTEEQKARFRDQSTNWHLTVVESGTKWSLQELDASGNAVGSPQPVAVPTPQVVTTSLPPATLHRLYEAKVTTNTPATVRYEVTAGALPKGLTLNQDTGGIVGTPVRARPATFTITARSTDGRPAAQATYDLTVHP
ncbi:Ig domain-containing protein [Nonomuraea sediminis]|uniref:Ig domain-containing protein n=1 Tax=Nonomuraea sediminis TaxID=2835864 RepID=UPI001BDC7A0F|nr:Ig domain-containing protein [Nonomuraea sediminis]